LDSNDAQILTTAFCSVLLLKRKLGKVQWLSLTLLAMGVAVIQLQAKPASSIPVTSQPLLTKPSISRDEDTLDFELPEMNQFLGICAVVLMALSSGFASTYFELVLKAVPAPPKTPTSPSNDILPRHLGTPLFTANEMSRDSSAASNVPLLSPALLAPPVSITPRIVKPAGLWVRNVQLSCFALLMGFLMFFLEANGNAFKSVWEVLGSTWWSGDPLDGGLGFLEQLRPVTALAGDFFEGLQIIGGLIAALVIKVRQSRFYFSKLNHLLDHSMPTISPRTSRPPSPSSSPLSPRSFYSTFVSPGPLSLALVSSFQQPGSSTLISTSPLR
jgi:hypothetical protein